MPSSTKKLTPALLVALTGTGLAVGAVLPSAMPQEAKAADAAVTTSSRIFAPDSFWYRQMPANAPLDTESSTKMKSIFTSSVKNYGDAQRNLPSMTMNTHRYAPPIYIATNADPIARYSFDDCQGKGGDYGLVANHLTGIHVPASAVPADGTDMEMTVYNKDTKQYTDTWVTRKPGTNNFTACWGGTIRDASKSQGVFDFPFGATASGLSLWGGTVKADELRRGEINHVVGISLPPDVVKAGAVPPANRTDGSNWTDLPGAQEGQYMKLPADLNIDAMKLNPTTKAMAKAAQKYGFVVWDRAGSTSFRTENPKSLGSDPYEGGEKLFHGLAYWNVMWGDSAKGEQAFPFDKLQLVKAGYIPPAGSVTTPPPTTPAPVPTTPVPTKPPVTTVPTTPPTTTTPPATGSYTVTGSSDATSFGFKANALPAGGKMEVTWTMAGKLQSTTTQALSWWSGDKTGYSNPSAVVKDAAGNVVARSTGGSTTPTTPPTTTQPTTPSSQYTLKANNLGDSFSVDANAMPAGGKMYVWWTQNGSKQYSSTTAKSFWSSNKPGWNYVYSELQDSSGKIVATATLNR